MQTSEQIDQLATALAAAVRAMKPIPKAETGQIGSRQYKYADLATVIEAVRKPLADAGLVVVQTPEVNGAGFVLVTRLQHVSGQWLEASYPLPTDVGSQELGSALTYARRYSLCAVLGVAAEDDDDGALASVPAPRRESAPGPLADTGLGICAKHGVPYFKTPRMKTPAHRTSEGGWCSKPTRAEQPPDTTPARMSLAEFGKAVLDSGYGPPDVNAVLGMAASDWLAQDPGRTLEDALAACRAVWGTGGGNANA